MRVLESAIMQHCCCNDFCGGILVVYEIYCLLLCCSLFIYGIDYFWLKPLIQWQRTGGQTLWQTHCCDPSHRTSNEYLCFITNVPYGDDGDFFDTWLHFAQMNGLWNGRVMHFAAQKLWYVYLFAPAIVYYTKTGRETWVWRLLARPSIQYGRFHSVPITAYSNTLSFHFADGRTSPSHKILIALIVDPTMKNGKRRFIFKWRKCTLLNKVSENKFEYFFMPTFFSLED